MSQKNIVLICEVSEIDKKSIVPINYRITKDNVTPYNFLGKNTIEI